MKPLRIYLSSTYEDLKQHRAVVFELLEKAGLPVARMEGYVASDQRPLDLCLQDVAKSDVYVGLFAWRYGYVPPPEHGNPDGRSITELEYRHARDKGQPKLIFLADPSTEAGWPERFRDEKTGDGDCGARLVHDMIRAALASNVSDRASQHAKLLDAWGDRHRLPHAYAWRWIGYHLHGAGRQAELETLLLDLDWLRAKLDATEIYALVREFGYASGSSPLRDLQDALRLSSHVLAKSKSQLPGQLLARLPESEGSLRQSILERASKSREPWLRPLRPSLTGPGGPLVRTLEGHASWVTAVALTPDGKRAVSGAMTER